MIYILEETNRQSSDKWVECEFILVDQDGIMPELRLYKSFPNCSVTEELIELSKQVDPLYHKAEYLRKIGFKEIGVET